jgi:hypothetical protein
VPGSAGAQFVGGVGDEAALRGEGVFQPFEQPVNGVAEVFQLIGRAGHGELLMQVASEIRRAVAVMARSGRSTRPAMTQPSTSETTAMMPSTIADTTRRLLTSAAC